MQHLPRPETAQPHPQFCGTGNGLPAGLDPILDDQRRRIVGRRRAARAHRQLKVEHRVTRDRGEGQAEEPAASRIAQSSKGELRRVLGGAEQPQRRLRVDDIDPPGRPPVVVPVRWLLRQAVGEGEHRISAEQRDHVLVRAPCPTALAQGRRRNGGGIHVTARGMHREATVDATGRGADEELGGIGGSAVDDPGPELDVPPRHTLGRGERLHRRRQRVERRRVVLGRCHRAHVWRQRGDVHRSGGTQQVDTGCDHERAGGRPLRPLVAGRDWLHCERGAQVG